MSDGYALEMHLTFTAATPDEAAQIKVAAIEQLLANTPWTIVSISRFGPTTPAVAEVPDTTELDTEVAV